jgi:hypothetical protein
MMTRTRRRTKNEIEQDEARAAAEVEALFTAEPLARPCDHCRHAPRCASLTLACDALAMWRAGRATAMGLAPRVPSRARYEAMAEVAGRPPKRRPIEWVLEDVEE